MIVLMNTMKSGKKINLNGLSNVQQKIAMESWKNNPDPSILGENNGSNICSQSLWNVKHLTLLLKIGRLDQ